jgi:dipeptidyl aminopeptidase/acylaminoacyl peptidase
MTSERQLTAGPLQKDLDANINFSPDGTRLVFDCRGPTGINGNDRLGVVNVETGAVTVFYTQIPPTLGVGAPSFLNDHEVVAIHALEGHPYDFTVRGGRIIAADGSGNSRWLDSRDITPPFTPGALRGGTHKHEPDASGQWVGFTYNDHIMKFARGSDLRNVGVSRRGHPVPVHADPDGRNFAGESFSVLLTACVDHPQPGTDQYQRAEADCWVGREGYPTPHGPQRARAFRGLVTPADGGAPISEVFVVDVPDDLTIPGPLGPLEGTETDYPKPPKGALVRRLTHTATARNPALRGVSGHLRADNEGRWIAYIGMAERAGHIAKQIFVVAASTGKVQQVSHLPGGVTDSLRISPDGHYVVGVSPDGSVMAWSTDPHHWGKILMRTSPSPHPATNPVISPDSNLIAYNREIEGTAQIFVLPASL